MYGLVGIRPMMLITAACLMSAAMVECFIRLAKPLSNQDDAGICLLDVIIGDMHSATVFLLRKEPTVARLAGVCTWINLILTGFSSVSFPYIIRTTLGYDAATYGLCDGIIGIAGIAGTFIAGCFANRLKSRNALRCCSWKVLCCSHRPSPSCFHVQRKPSSSCWCSALRQS